MNEDTCGRCPIACSSNNSSISPTIAFPAPGPVPATAVHATTATVITATLTTIW